MPKNKYICEKLIFEEYGGIAVLDGKRLKKKMNVFDF